MSFLYEKPNKKVIVSVLFLKSCPKDGLRHQPCDCKYQLLVATLNSIQNAERNATQLLSPA